MPPRDVRHYGARCDRLGNDPPLLLVTPMPTGNHAGNFRAAPNRIRVVTNVIHNVHTIPTEPDRAPSGLSPPCELKAPLTVILRPDQMVSDGRREAARLLQRMLELGISRPRTRWSQTSRSRCVNSIGARPWLALAPRPIGCDRGSGAVSA